MTEELPKGDVGSGLAAIPDPRQIPSATDALAATTSDAVGTALENPDSAVKMMKKRLANAHASPALLNILEPMPESKTGVGVRSKDGTLYEVVFIWDNYGKIAPMLYLKRTLRVEGSSLSGIFEIERAFYIASFSDPFSGMKQGEELNNRAFECQHALANNPALAGRLSVGGKHESGIRIVYTTQDNREFVFYLTGDRGVAIFERNSRRPVSGFFDPDEVTAEELDEAIDRSSESAA